MRWSEQQLEAHLKAHRNKAERSKLRLKSENDAKVHQARKNIVQEKLEPNTEYDEKQVLFCEVAATPPSVNHYWERTEKGMKLSERAQRFHALMIALIPALRLSSRLKLEVVFHFPDRRRRDIDNPLKATIDSLVKCGLCDDDEQFDELIVKRGAVVKGGLIRLKVWEL
ncbi:RusA family crossover junction endodeoxyribonuclease [Acinetobacter defluvii]|uniref:RusA family crossover junction endodeoxyribonuclease n=1 Tax=Acinetobacter defluvii TaxID=1871111 RepID=A0A2S2FE80_9GAMM|nr:RusA family crossover junction endodeoxyribonuclease [Acinetobacter defluvii]AWL29249.1 RusA family crossover junction endodeoxyribonuclease [Acinetobacter defluvii]